VEDQKPYGLAIDQTNVFEINGQRIRFLLQQSPKRAHAVTRNLPTDAQNDTVVANHLAVDSAAHSHSPSQRASLLRSHPEKCNPLATCNLLKTKERELSRRRRECREFRESREFRHFCL
jgi:hypothetical protein